MSRDIWVISDTHFRHKNVLKFTDRDGNLVRGHLFKDVDEMDAHMIERWNSVVKQGDIVYHLGDVVIANTDEDQVWFKKTWPSLNGSKRLIVGNHDDIKFLSSGGFFKKVYMWRMFLEFGLLLTHVPVHQSSLRIYAVEDKYTEGDVATEQKQFLNLHGHIHQNSSPEGPYRNMSVEAINYTPVNIEELRIK